MTNLPTNPEQDPVGSDEWFDTEFRKIFDEEFPETACPAAKAVEGTGTPRVEENRFAGDAS